MHPDSLDYEQWWDEQISRCLYGWKDGGYEVPGTYYYHLNFKKINLVDESNRPLLEHPFFSFEDQELFNDIAYARKVKKGIMLITGRGFGKSFDVASVIEHEFTFYDATECIVSASVALFADELWQKIELGLNSQPDDLRLSLLIDKTDLKLSGTKIKVEGKEKKIGRMSKMRKVIYDNDEGRTRGTRPTIHAWEEIGSWSGAAALKDCVKATEPSWWRGSVFMCLPIFIGTGGQMKTGASKDAREMGFDPKRFNLLEYEYKEQKIVKFYPAYKKYGGYYEKTGISDEVGAKADLDRRREEKLDNIEDYSQFCQEFPYDIYEAFQESGGNNFDQKKLSDRYNFIYRTPSLKNRVKNYRLEPVIAGGKIIDVECIQDPKGLLEMLEDEKPMKDQSGKPIKNLYVSGCDSFDAAEDEVLPELSPGCIRIFKRMWRADITGRLFVAGLTMRARNGSDFYLQTLLANMLFGCKMLYEHTNKGIASWYITNGVAEQYLYERPSLDGIVKNSKSSHRYGIQMPGPVKVHVIGLYRKYIDDSIDDMYFLPQIKDAMEFRFGSKEHHETMATSIALFADTSMYDLKIKEMKKSARRFPTFGTLPNGQRSFDVHRTFGTSEN